jgi:pimeloyl-ACP methyl ester carboxylesterase
MTYALAEADLRDLLPRIEAPTLLIHGDADERSSLDFAHAQVRRSERLDSPRLTGVFVAPTRSM